MHGCTCINNTADGEGGCLMATDTAYLDVQDSSIYGNVAGSGAGLSVDGYVELRVINSVIVYFIFFLLFFFSSNFFQKDQTLRRTKEVRFTLLILHTGR